MQHLLVVVSLYITNGVAVLSPAMVVARVIWIFVQVVVIYKRCAYCRYRGFREIVELTYKIEIAIIVDHERILIRQSV